MMRPSRWALLTTGAAVVVVSTLVMLGVVAATGGYARHPSRNAGSRNAASCSVPPLPGTVVTVALADLRSMMRGGRSMMSQQDWPRFHHGMMTVTARPSQVAAGTVSLRVVNTGYLTHELVILPLADGQLPGQRPIGADGQVDETGSLGEASATCAAGSGDGIAAGSAGWVSRTLAPGRYELLCNLPGHYAGGMYTELDLA